jgi:predicted nucleic acid-binding protein
VEKQIRFLVDTNIWLEQLLDQEKSAIVNHLFKLLPAENIFISDFSLHSIGVILSRLSKLVVFEQFIDDLFINAQIEILTLDPADLIELTEFIQKYKLDFDDAYQYSICQKFEMTLITYDKDFKIKGLKKTTPEEILSHFK